MSREIKFRAWLKDENKMYSVSELQLSQDGVVCCNLGDYEGPYFYVDLKDIELMQYTGLKDKNGVEIYEGDVFIDEYDGYIGVIKYGKKFAWFIVEWYINSHSKEPCDDEPLGHINIHNIEVIGNIYENLELLEVENE